MEKQVFDKNNTLFAKGIAIIMMFVHHNFLDEERFGKYVVDFFPFTQESVMYIADFFKICVGMFVFLTAYGIMMSYKKSGSTVAAGKTSVILTLNRYLSLMSGFLFAFLSVHIVSLLAGKQWYTKRYGAGMKSAVYCVVDGLGLAQLFGTPTANATWWYMSLAIVIIFIMPLLIRWYKKDGVLCLALVVLIPFILKMPSNYLTRYLLALMLGIYCADKDLLAKMKEKQIAKNRYMSKAIKFAVSTIMLVALVVLRESSFKAMFIPIWDGLIPAFVIYYGYEFLNGIPVVKEIGTFIGKYSMDMFLTHTFLRAYWFGDFIYGFKYAWLDTLVLLVCSLLVAICMEKIKTITRYNLLMKNLRNKVLKQALFQ